MLRPKSVTVIAWILIVTACLNGIAMVAMMGNPLVTEMAMKSPIPIPIQYVLETLGLAINVVTGLALLKGKSWGRNLFVIWSVVGFVIALVASPFKAPLIGRAIFVAIVVYFLFRAPASRYFDQAREVSRSGAL